MIYYAPDDTAVFVPKQRGIDQTLNFARTGAWLFLIGVLVLPLAISAAVVLVANR
ncbi:MAG: hypothetical protein KF718_26490 [Polyangiaceae bacterium]|nr:hypothetical protein [Polyangiaceae bacterium]